MCESSTKHKQAQLTRTHLYDSFFEWDLRILRLPSLRDFLCRPSLTSCCFFERSVFTPPTGSILRHISVHWQVKEKILCGIQLAFGGTITIRSAITPGLHSTQHDDPLPIPVKYFPKCTESPLQDARPPAWLALLRIHLLSGLFVESVWRRVHQAHRSVGPRPTHQGCLQST